MRKPESTSRRVAKIAGRILATISKRGFTDDENIVVEGFPNISICDVGELEALAASCLTQAVDKKGAK